MAPPGTVCFLFTDIVGSTSLWETVPAMSDALDQHNRLVSHAIEAEGGDLFSNTGDGFAAAFEDADAAVRAAIRAHEALGRAAWPDGAEIATRMGIHAGDAEARDGNYFGPTVNRAARLMSLAGRRQLLISRAVEVGLSDELRDALALHPLGRIELKDVREPMMVFSVETDDVERAEALTPRPARAVGNLPAALTRLVGRDEDLVRLRDAIAAHRLTTLIGPGGAGKTTLAIEAARGAGDLPDGAWFIPLADIADGSGLLGAFGRALEVSGAGQSLERVMQVALRHRRLLLVIDNCEHVLGEVADVVDTVLSDAAGVRVLATSREPLHIAGENVIVLGPLDLSRSEDQPSDAAQLYIDRVATAGGVVRPEDLPAIEELCERLDGLPLAIELAAAKTRALRPRHLLELLENRFELLTSANRRGDRRHQTLRALVESSYELLRPDEQLTFSRLGVLSGSFDLDDAIAVASTDAEPAVAVVNAVAALVDKSLVQHRAVASEAVAPYHLLETLREYALDRLRHAGEEGSTRARHACHHRELAADVRRRCFGPAEKHVADRVRVGRADFEAAVRWAASNGELDLAIAIVVDLNALALLRGWRHAPTWLAHLLDEKPTPTPPLWADFLAASAATALHEYGSARRAIDLAREAVALDDGNPQAHVVLAQTSRTPDECLAHANVVFEEGERRKDRMWMMAGRVYECYGLLAAGRNDEVLRRARELLRLADEAGDRSTTGWALSLTARALSASDPARAMVVLEESRAIAEEMANPQLEINARRQRAAALLAGRDPEAAEASIRRVLLRALDLGEIDSAMRTCSLAAMTLAERGRDEPAALIIGRLGLPVRTPADHALYRRIEGDLAARLGDRYEELRDTGRELGHLDVIDLTLSEIGGS